MSTHQDLARPLLLSVAQQMTQGRRGSMGSQEREGAKWVTAG